MTNKMLQFVDIGQQNPPKRDKSERKEDFGEIYQEFIHDRAKEQSSRCSQCGVPFCQVHCPLSNNIPNINVVQAITFKFLKFSIRPDE